MSWRLIARKEIGDARRNRQLVTNVAMFTLLFGVVAYLYVRDARGSAVDPEQLVGLLSAVSLVIVPAAALMVAYEAVVKRRSNGQLALLLGMPHDRRDVVIGAYLGRFAVFAVSLAAGVLAAALVVTVFRVSLAVPELLGFLLAAMALGLAYVAIGICLSSVIRSPTWASIGAFAVFLMFVFVWWLVPEGVVYLVNGLETPAESPWWEAYLRLLSPSVAYQEVLGVALGEGRDGEATSAVVVLLAWAVLAPVLGYLRFDGADL